MANASGTGLMYGLEDKPGWGTAVFVGFQHFLAMFASIITPSLVLCRGVGAGAETTGLMLSASLLTSGVATWIQIHRLGMVGSGLLSVQGTSSAFIAVMAGMGAALVAEGASPEMALGTMLGTSAACALLEVGLSFVLPLARKVLTPVVAGTVILLLGLNLIGIAMNKFAGGAAAAADGTFGSWRHLALGVASMGTVLVCNRLPWGWCRIGSALFGILAGMALAAGMGMLSPGGPPEHAVSWPRWLPLELHVSWGWVAPMLVLYVATTVETIGDITATSLISGEPTEGAVYEKRLRGGILADGLNTMGAALFGAFPTTSFSQNNGVIQLTGVASRRCGMAVAGLLALAGLSGAVARFFMRVPEAVMGGVCLVLFCLVAVAGIRLLAPALKGNREVLAVAAGLGAGLGVVLRPDALGGLPEWARSLFGSGVVTGTVAVLAAQAILGRTEAGSPKGGRRVAPQ
jgi:xanthine permease XanP